jgi:hypothetical protein
MGRMCRADVSNRRWATGSGHWERVALEIAAKDTGPFRKSGLRLSSLRSDKTGGRTPSAYQSFSSPLKTLAISLSLDTLRSRHLTNVLRRSGDPGPLLTHFSDRVHYRSSVNSKAGIVTVPP